MGKSIQVKKGYKLMHYDCCNEEVYLSDLSGVIYPSCPSFGPEINRNFNIDVVNSLKEKFGVDKYYKCYILSGGWSRNMDDSISGITLEKYCFIYLPYKKDGKLHYLTPIEFKENWFVIDNVCDMFICCENGIKGSEYEKLLNGEFCFSESEDWVEGIAFIKEDDSDISILEKMEKKFIKSFINVIDDTGDFYNFIEDYYKNKYKSDKK